MSVRKMRKRKKKVIGVVGGVRPIGMEEGRRKKMERYFQKQSSSKLKLLSIRIQELKNNLNQISIITVIFSNKKYLN